MIEKNSETLKGILYYEIKTTIITASLHDVCSGPAQKSRSSTFNIGDAAPELRVGKWLKGAPIDHFERGKVYVLEFWATWCKPCIAAMPHLSELADKYKNKVTILAIDIHEPKATSIEQVRDFVKGMGDRMNFPVVTEDINFTVRDWLDAFGAKEEGIPITFVINKQGKVVWVGQPYNVGVVLQKILNNTWDINAALSKRIFNKYLEKLDGELFYKLHRFDGDYNNAKDLGKPDSALIVIAEMIKKEPRLKYAPAMVSFTFSALLRTDPHKAYEFGKQVMVTSTYTEPAYESIIGCIEDDSRKLDLPAEIYRLGAECYEAEIDNAPYRKLVETPKMYQKMARWYRLANDGPKGMEADQKAAMLSH